MPRRRSGDLVEETFQFAVGTLVSAGAMDPANRKRLPFHAMTLGPPGYRILRGECCNVVDAGATVALDVVAQVLTADGWSQFTWSTIRLDQAPSHRPQGGWRFICPHEPEIGKPCGRPVRTLFLALNEDCRFRCRTCAGLRYRSATEADKRLDRFKQNPEALKNELARALVVLSGGHLPSTTQRLALRAAGRLAQAEGQEPDFLAKLLAPNAPEPSDEFEDLRLYFRKRWEPLGFDAGGPTESSPRPPAEEEQGENDEPDDRLPPLR